MAKSRKVLPARKLPDEPAEQALLLRSAESLGRVIGALQRQLEDATRRQSDGGRATRHVAKAVASRGKKTSRKRPAPQKRTGRKKTTRR